VRGARAGIDCAGLPGEQSGKLLTARPFGTAKVFADITKYDVDVPFPAGVAVDKWLTVVVSAFSVAPGGGLTGAPPGIDTSGQVWRLRL
jgi:hypothetical protein